MFAGTGETRPIETNRHALRTPRTIDRITHLLYASMRIAQANFARSFFIHPLTLVSFAECMVRRKTRHHEIGAHLIGGSLQYSRVFTALPSSKTFPRSSSAQNRCRRSPKSNPIVMLLRLFCLVIWPRAYPNAHAFRILFAFSSNLVRRQPALTAAEPLSTATRHDRRCGLGAHSDVPSPSHTPHS
jgi:hypothetical protein